MLNLIMNYLINMFLPGRCSQREPKLKLLRLMQSKLKNCRFLAFWSSYTQNGDRQDFRITPYINYAYIYCLNKTKDRTKLSLWLISAIIFKSFDFFLRACLHGVVDPGLVGLVSFVFTLWKTQNKRNLPH